MKKIKLTYVMIALTMISLSLNSCVSKKKHKALTGEKESLEAKFKECDLEYDKLKTEMGLRKEQIEDLKKQLEEYKQMSKTQLNQVGDLTVLSQEANKNINATLAQMEKKDKYIHMLQSAKNKTDSVNLALAVNLKSALKDGLMDNDIDVRIDKTVVMIDLSDKMLYKSASADLTNKANDVLEKIAKILEGRKDLEILIESHTDARSISNTVFKDNWDLSVKRSTAVARVLQSKYNIDPAQIIPAGRGEFKPVASNDSEEGRAKNRRTRIVIMPKLDQFYDLLDPTKVPQ